MARTKAARPTIRRPSAIHHGALKPLKALGLVCPSVRAKPPRCRRATRSHPEPPSASLHASLALRRRLSVFMKSLDYSPEIAGTIQGCHVAPAPALLSCRPQRFFVAAVSSPALCDVRLNSYVRYYEEPPLAARCCRRAPLKALNASLSWLLTALATLPQFFTKQVRAK